MNGEIPSFISKFMDGVRANALERTLRGVKRLSPREIEFSQKRCIDFSSNDYLGFSMRPELIEASVAATRKYGASSGAARLISGTNDAYLELEEKLAAWKGFESAIIIGSGYMANSGAVEALSHKDSFIFADKLNHASINKGCQLSQAKFLRYRHNDMAHLETILEREGENARDALLVSDTVFSMDGDTAPIQALAETAKKHSLLLYLDDAHGSGVFGENGKGLADSSNCDAALATFSKALGAYGGAILCSKELKAYLVNSCAPFIFSTALPPGVIASVSSAIDLLRTDELAKSRKRLLDMSFHVRDTLNSWGYSTLDTNSMIIPVVTCDSEKTLRFSRTLFENGIYALAVRPPTVPAGTARIRLSLNAEHTDSDIEKLLEVFNKMR